MLTSFRFWLIIAAIFAIVGGFWSRSPYDTALPLDVDDLSPIQAQLDQLPDDDRKLVLGYLKRSNGDVLPAAFADPDAPFTARTLRQAIALQKEFMVAQDQRDTEADARQLARENLMAPLRKALTLRVVARQMLTERELHAPPEAPGLPKQASAGFSAHEKRILVVTYRLQNVSTIEITSATGSVSIRDAADRELTGCWIEHDDALAAGSTVDIRCGNVNKPGGSAEVEFVAMPMSALSMQWEPRSLAFADGRKLHTGL